MANTETVVSPVVVRFLTPNDAELIEPYFKTFPQSKPDLRVDLVVGAFDEAGNLVGIVQARPTFILSNLQTQTVDAAEEMIALLHKAIELSGPQECLLVKSSIKEDSDPTALVNAGYRPVECEVWAKKVV